MSSTARILNFPQRRFPVEVTAEEASLVARSYVDAASGSPDLAQKIAHSPEILFSICKILREEAEIQPARTAERASELYRSLAGKETSVGLFDELEYLRGEAAFLAGSALRYTGRLEESERWLDRADAAFRHTVNPAPLHANVALARLALRFAQGRHDDVLELLPSVLSSFEKLKMNSEATKALFLNAISLYAAGRHVEALELMLELRTDPIVRSDVSLAARVLVHIGDYLGAAGKHGEAARAYEEALPVVQRTGKPVLLAELKWSVAETYRTQGLTERAIEAFRSAREEYAALEMAVHVAQLQLVTAESLLALNRPREAEWEILAALPTIEEQKMVPEGFAAVALLKESVRRRKADPNALRELREHLQANQK